MIVIDPKVSLKRSTSCAAMVVEARIKNCPACWRIKESVLKLSPYDVIA
jgi:hypothetical protein